MATRQRYPSVLTPDVFRDGAVPPRGFFNQLGMVIFQPGAFFHTLPVANRSRSWLWAAILILVLVSFSAIQHPTSTDAAGEVAAPLPAMDVGTDTGGAPAGPFPPEGPAPVVAESGDPAAAWMTGVKTAGAQVLQWAVLVIVLAEVTMFNGRAPQIARNLQIAIWTSIPLALVAVVQLVYLANGGSIGEPGVTGFLAEWDTFAESDPYIRSFIYGVASQLTLFWLWSLALIYIAARKTLHGKRSVVILVIALWVVIMGIGSGYPYYKDITAGETQPPAEEVMPSEQPGMDDVSTGEMPESRVPMEPDPRIEQRRQP